NLISVSSGKVYKFNTGVIYPYCDTTTSSSFSRITWNGSTFGVVAGRELHPVTMVSWYGAVAFATWRSAVQERPLGYDLASWECQWNEGYRLPTEAEWEKAARGGVSGHRFAWSDTDSIEHAQANYYSSTTYYYDTSPTLGYHPLFAVGMFPYTSPAGVFAPNDYDVYDMTGNVWEWCHDRYSSTYYDVSPDENPRGPTVGTTRVYRGGCWSGSAFLARTANRAADAPANRFYYLGFRCAASLP
ncbi:MAG: SUMF1/EgtB/PvdO family nonheme iron enzyme, partial [Phycisphaerae bacterium]|nr:SUMF1/EgtB/PvdO family nonheme iron enzyme [Phycisphaerae bacterium]